MVDGFEVAVRQHQADGGEPLEAVNLVVDEQDQAARLADALRARGWSAEPGWGLFAGEKGLMELRYLVTVELPRWGGDDEDEG